SPIPAMARTLVLILVHALVSVVKSDVGYNLPSPAYGVPDLRAEASEIVEEVDPVARLAGNIPGGGIPGENYPILASVPETKFACEDMEFPGYYADTADEAACQVFHVCTADLQLESFLCPNGSVFNQQYFVCDWWFNVDCAASEDFFRLNADIEKLPEVEPLPEASDLRNSYAPPSDVAPPAELYNLPRDEEPVITTAPPPPPTEVYILQEEVTDPAQLYNLPEPTTLPPPPPPPLRLYYTPNRRRSFRG
ncbi:unnamed protein product, partial [Meganyctiphanes norvegica]